MTTNDVLALVLRLSVVGTLGIAVVGPLRVLARRTVGAEAAYWLWVLVPAILIAALLPRAPSCLCGPETFVAPLLIRGISRPLDFAPSTAVDRFALTATLVWAIGAAAVLVCFAHGQRSLRKSLGILKPHADGSYRALAVQQPMVIGAWRPRIVLPDDFEVRYSGAERALILAHEHAHLDRRDALTNALAVGCLCLFWFNPLMYWALNRFRFDQESACDAAVLRRLRVPPRRYARALAKTHLMGRIGIAFGWRRRHPLLTRIALLGHPVPRRIRRVAGYLLALALTFCGTYVVWAARPDLPEPTLAPGPWSGTEAGKLLPNFKNVDIARIADAVALTTRKKIILDPQVHATVTLLLDTPISPETFYRLFLDMLSAHGFVAVPDGDAIKVQPGPRER
jgi:bla regulator protein blaR1